MSSNTKKKFDIQVKQGIIHINSVHVSQCTNDVIYMCADCVQKYPVVGAYSDLTVFLDADKNTLNVTDKSLNPTEISIENLHNDPGHTWRIVAETGRYECLIVVVRDLSKEKQINLDPFEELHWWHDGNETNT